MDPDEVPRNEGLPWKFKLIITQICHKNIDGHGEMIHTLKTEYHRSRGYGALAMLYFPILSITSLSCFFLLPLHSLIPVDHFSRSLFEREN